MKIQRSILACLLIGTNLLTGQAQWEKISSELIVDSPAFRQCHASTIVPLGSRRLLAAWFGGSGEGAKDVCIWMAASNGGRWAKPTIIADGIVNDTLRYPTWNPVLFKASNGMLFLFYKVGPSPRTWWGMFKTSRDNGKTWSSAQRMPDNLLGPIKNKPVQLKDGTILSGSSVETSDKWSVHIERSTDGGHSWVKIPVDPGSSFDVIQPSILTYPGGRLQLLCRSKQGVVVQAWSADNGKTWGKFSKTSLINPNSGIDAVTLHNGQQLIVYNPDLPGKDWFNGRSKLHVAISADGLEWKDIMVLEDGTKEEFSYPAVIQAADGKVHITYTYDRKNIKHVVLAETGR